MIADLLTKLNNKNASQFESLRGIMMGSDKTELYRRLDDMKSEVDPRVFLAE
jgi:hypothetical protein